MPDMKENLLKIKWKDMVLIFIQMVKYTKGILNQTNSMVKELLNGMMVNNIVANM